MASKQKNVNAITGISISASLTALYYTHLGSYIPDFPQEQTLVTSAGLLLAWLWFRFLDKDRDGILDIIEPSHGGAEAEEAPVDEHIAAPEASSANSPNQAPRFNPVLVEPAPVDRTKIEETITNIHLELEKLIR